MKIYFICDGRNKPYYNCVGMLSNGFVFNQYLTNVPDFAPYDLYFDRRTRMSSLHQMFGVDPNIVDTEMLVIKSDKDLPDWWYSMHDKQDKLVGLYDQFASIIEREKRDLPTLQRNN